MTANWVVPVPTSGSRRTAARVTSGATCLSSSSHFPLRPNSNCIKPVVLPPGGRRNVFRYILRLSDRVNIVHSVSEMMSQAQTRLIPSEVKKEVWKRDKGQCVICGATTNLH